MVSDLVASYISMLHSNATFEPPKMAQFDWFAISGYIYKGYYTGSRSSTAGYFYESDVFKKIYTAVLSSTGLTVINYLLLIYNK